MPYVNTIERVEREKAVHEGEQLGIEKGRHEGVEGTLRKQVVLKFGDLPDWADERIASASDVQLDEWVVQILTADSLEALLGKH